MLSRSRNCGKFPSLKLNRSVAWKSFLERDYILLLEYDGEVLSYKEQPLHIQFYFDDELHRFTPNLLVERKNERQLIQIEHSRKPATGLYAAISSIVAGKCREQGYEFVVVPESIIREQPRLDNIRLLWRYARTPVDLQHLLYCREFFCTAAVHNLEALVSFFESKGNGAGVVYALLYHGVLSADLSLALNKSVITPGRILTNSGIQIEERH